MLKEEHHIRQLPGDLRRRWFSSDQFDLILWLNDDGSFAGFELCYDRLQRERSLIWRPATGYLHMAVDDGEHRFGKHKATPVLVADGRFDVERIREAFVRQSRSLPRDVAEYVLTALASYPESRPVDE